MDNFDAPDPVMDAAANPAEVPPETADAVDNALAWSDPTANAGGGGFFPEISPLVGADPAVGQMAQGIQDVLGTDAGQVQTDQILNQMNSALDSSSIADTQLRSQLEDALGSMNGGADAGDTTPWFGVGETVPQDAGEDAANPAPADDEPDD